MANEDFLLRLGLDPGSTAADVQKLIGQIANDLKKLKGQDIIDLDQIDQLKTRLKSAVEQGFKGSDVFAGLPEQFKAALSGVEGQSGKFLAEQAALFAREIDLAVARATQRASRNASGTAYVTGRDLGNAAPGAERQRLFQVTSDTGQEATLAADKKLASALASRERAVRALEAAEAKEAKAVQSASEADGRAINAINRRAAADAKAAAAAEAKAAADRLASAKASFAEGQQVYRLGLNDQQRQAALAEFQRRQALPYGNTDTSTALGRSQEQVNKSTEAVITAQNRLAAEMNKAVPDVERMVSASRQLRTAEETLAAAQKRTAALSEAPPSGLAAQFGLGFRGKSGDPYAVQLGQAAKFSLLYGTAYKALFAFTQTLQQTLQEGIQFEQSVSELKLATGQSADAAKKLANELGQQAAAAGFSPSEGAEAGARAVGLYGASNSSAATQDTIARISTDVATKLAFNSGMQIQDVQTNLAAITNAFQLGYAGQGQIADLDAYFSHKFGVAPGQTIQSVAESGSVAQQAGFNLQQVSAIAALLQGRTGQSADAVAGYMAQIFSRGGEGSLGKVTSKYGISQSETLSQQLADLAKIYKSASPNEQNEIAASFGRGKVQNAVSVLLGSFDDVSKAAEGASKGLADGSADKAFSERMNNLGGQLQLLMADFKEFANLLGQSGVLFSLGLAIEGLKDLLESANALLRVWDELPGAIKGVVASLALLAIASRTAAGTSALNSVLPGVSAGLASPIGGGAARTFVSTAGGGSASLFSRAGAGAIGGALLSAAPWIAAVGGLYAIGSVTNNVSKFNDSMKAATDALDATTTDLKTPEQWSARANGLRSQAGQTGNLSGLTKGLDWLLTGGSLADAGADKRQALLDEAKRDAAQAKLTTSATAAPLTSNHIDADTLSSALTAMSTGGKTAAQQFDYLRNILLKTGGAAKAVVAAFDPKEFAGRAASPATEGITAALREGNNAGTANLLAYYTRGASLNPGSLSNTQVQDALEKSLKAAGIKSGNINSKQAGQVASGFVDKNILNGLTYSSDLSNVGVSESEFKAYRDALIKQVKKALEGQATDVNNALDQNQALTKAGITALVNDLITSTQGKASLLPKSDLAGQAKVWQQAVKTIERSIKQQKANGGAVPAQVIAQLQSAQGELVQAQIDQLEGLRKAAQQNAGKNKSLVASIGKSYFRREVNAAIAQGRAGQDALISIVQTAGKWGQDAIISILQNMLATVQAAEKTYIDMQKAAGAAGSSLGYVLQHAAQQYGGKIKGLQGMIDAVKNSTHGDDSSDPYATGSDIPGYTAPSAAKAAKPKESAAERRQKMLDIRASLRQLSIDMTDPLAEARVAVADALDKVKNAVTRQDKLAAKVDLQNARNELESTKFSQRLQDVQTADDLGRISHLKYIAYLDHEHDRLNAIKHRTYQQQQELDQVDELIKSAQTDLEGQWNFGDITLPTPYQVKRRVEELYGNVVNPGKGGGGTATLPRDPGTGRTVTIHINGADTGKVKEIIREYARGQVTVRTSSTRKR